MIATNVRSQISYCYIHNSITRWTESYWKVYCSWVTMILEKLPIRIQLTLFRVWLNPSSSWSPLLTTVSIQSAPIMKPASSEQSLLKRLGYINGVHYKLTTITEHIIHWYTTNNPPEWCHNVPMKLITLLLVQAGFVLILCRWFRQSAYSRP